MLSCGLEDCARECCCHLTLSKCHLARTASYAPQWSYTVTLSRPVSIAWQRRVSTVSNALTVSQIACQSTEIHSHYLMNHERIQHVIQQKYAEYGFTKGWRLWYHSVALLNSSPEVHFMGINPGGSGYNPDHGIYSQERGCAYLVENWGSSSQVKEPVPELFKTAGLDIATATISNFVPFRSEGEASLKQNPHYKMMLRWCDELWAELLKELRPRVVISVGAIPRDGLRRILGKPANSKEESAVSSSNSACRFRMDTYKNGPVESIVALPYPSSRYKLLTDPLLVPLTLKYLELGRDRLCSVLS